MKRLVSLLAILLTLGILYYFMIQGGGVFIRERNKEGRFIKRKGDRWYLEDSVLISKVFMGNLQRVITLPAVKYIPIGKEKQVRSEIRVLLRTILKRLHKSRSITLRILTHHLPSIRSLMVDMRSRHSTQLGRLKAIRSTPKLWEIS